MSTGSSQPDVRPLNEAGATLPTAAAVVACALAVLVVWGVVAGVERLDRYDDLPDRVETFGPFALVTHRGGVDRYSIRHGGSAVVIEGRAGMYGDQTAQYRTFNAAYTFSPDTPALVVNVGDPNNTSFFYLVREKDGQLHIEQVGETTGGTVSAGWIDRVAGRPVAPRSISLHRARLGTGRWLLLGDFAVLDVSSFVPLKLAQPDGAWVVSRREPVALSPNERSFLRIASGSSDDDRTALACFDLRTGAVDLAWIDPATMRYRDVEDIDAAWTAHYFEWRTRADGHEHPVARADARPLPWRGRLTVDRNTGARTYEVLPVREEMAGILAGFIERELGGQRRADEDPYSDAIELDLKDALVSVLYTDGRVRVWRSGDGSSRIVAEVAARFDEELASGAHDGLFLPAPPR